MNYYNQFLPSGYPYQQPQLSSPLVSTIPSAMPGNQPSNGIPSPKPGAPSNIVWAQGQEVAKAYNVAPGSSIVILDSDVESFYIKTCDETGRPSMRIFDYHERKQELPKATVIPSNEDFVSKKEFEAFREEVKKYVKQHREAKNNESTISTDDEIPYGIRER